MIQSLADFNSSSGLASKKNLTYDELKAKGFENLTDEELASLIDTTGENSKPDIAQLKQKIIDRLQPIIGPNGEAMGAMTLHEWNNPDLQSNYINQVLENILNGTPINAPGQNILLGNAANELKGTYQNLLSAADSRKTDQNVIRDLINSRKIEAEKNTALDTYLNQELPSALTANTEDYLSGVSNRAVDQFNQEMIPATREQANVRGLLYSGFPETSLTEKAIGTQSELDALRAKIEAENYQFLTDSSYQNKIKDLLKGVTDYRSALLDERNKQLVQQNNNFTAGQADITRGFQEKIAAENAQLQLSQQQAEMRRQNDAYKNQQKGQLISGIGSTIGSIAGAYYGGPTGAAIGGQVGGTIAGGVKG